MDNMVMAESFDEQDEHYVWQANPINVWVAEPPKTPLLKHVISGLQERLEARGCIFVERGDQPTPLGPVTHLAMGCWADYDEEISPLDFLTQMPKPRGQGMAISVIDTMPDDGLFDVARGLLVKKSGHVGIVVEGDAQSTEVKSILWASMAGNFRLLEGTESDLLDSVAFRVLAHIGAEKLTGHDGDEGTRLTWDAWQKASMHQEMAESARLMGDAKLIEDQVPLESYGTGKQVRHVLRYLNRSALGEGMRSQLDPDLRVMGVTTTGGGKINLSPDPMDGQIVPVGQVTRTGYVRAIPDGCPIAFETPSVETHENGMVYLAGALVNAGLVDSFEGFLRYLDDYFAEHEVIDILPEGVEPKATVLEHFHRQPMRETIKNPDFVEIVYPDTVVFPEIDFPCGVKEAEYHLISALFKAEAFRTPGRLDKIVLAVLPGHGSVALYGGKRSELIDFLTNGVEMESVIRV